MIFNNSKYTNTYFKIVNRARDRVLEGYSEKHHIIPRSLGGSDDSDNIAVLTGKEHYICHLLLTKMVSGKARHQMLYAFDFFYKTASEQRGFSGPRGVIYEKVRAEIIQAQRERWQDPDVREMMSQIQRDKWEDPEFRKMMTQKHKDGWEDPDRRQKRIDGIKNTLSDESVRQRYSEIRKEYLSDPDNMEKHLEAMKRGCLSPEARKKGMAKLQAWYKTPEGQEALKSRSQCAGPKSEAQKKKTSDSMKAAHQKRIGTPAELERRRKISEGVRRRNAQRAAQL